MQNCNQTKLEFRAKRANAIKLLAKFNYLSVEMEKDVEVEVEMEVAEEVAHGETDSKLWRTMLDGIKKIGVKPSWSIVLWVATISLAGRRAQ